MATFKSEFLADYWSRHGTPLRARALGNIHRVAQWGSKLAPLSNWIASSAPVRWLNEKMLDIDRRRMPPAWRRDTLARWLERNPGVALFHQRRHAVEHAAALAAAHGPGLGRKLRTLHAKGRAADRAARDEAHRRIPESKTHSSSRAVTLTSNIGA